MRARTFGWSLTLGVLVFSQAVALSQSVNQNGTLMVNGHSGQVPVVQLNGKSYVDVEALARVANGSISFNGDQIILTVPSAAAGASSAAAPAASEGLSKAFISAGIDQMGTIREWRAALINTVQNAFPVTPAWMADYSGAAQASLRQASLAVTTAQDKQAFQLLTNEYNNMHRSADRFLKARQNMTYVPQDALANDPLDQKIVACGHALADMASSGQYHDDPSCR